MRGPADEAPGRVVDAALYSDGRRVATSATPGDAVRELRARPGSLAWIGLFQPEHDQLVELASEFGLHALAVEDAVQAHQRPKLERYGDCLFVVLHPARYDDEQECVEFGELHLFVGADFVVTVRHGASPDLAALRLRLEEAPDLLRRGSETVLYSVLDAVVDGYPEVLAGLENDIDEIEDEVFRGEPAVSRRIYQLSREVAELQRAVRPLTGMLERLQAGFEKYHVDTELQRHLRDVADHVTRADEQVDAYRSALREILTVNATLVAQRQNERMTDLAEASNAQNDQVKKISGWAAVLFAPTLIGTVYGMNFDVMPELHWRLGYPFALLLMLGVSVSLFLAFRRRGWI